MRDGAIALFDARKPDLVLLDTRLPPVGGYEVAQRIREGSLLRHIPIIFMVEGGDDFALLHEGMAELVISCMQQSGAATPWFKLEVTETVTVDNFERVQATLQKIRDYGIQVAVDDFGTGYSTLGYLQKLPVDIIKIDRQFIMDIPTSSEDRTLVKAVVGMAHNLGLDVVAEGVETDEQALFLQQHQCDEMQGYLFAPPLPAGQFEQLISDQGRDENELTMF